MRALDILDFMTAHLAQLRHELSSREDWPKALAQRYRLKSKPGFSGDLFRLRMGANYRVTSQLRAG